MTADPVLTLSWLVLAHLAADFVFQTERIAFAKAAPGFRAWYGLAAHGLVVAVTLIPVALAFGAAGASALVVIAVSHGLIDRAKILLSRRSEARALRTGRHEHGTGSTGYVGPGWTPVPAALFIVDQLVHFAVLVVAWAVWIDGLAPTSTWVAAVDGIVGRWDAAVVHETTLTLVVLAALAIVNIRGAGFFVEALVDPRHAAGSKPGHAPSGATGSFGATTSTGTRGSSEGSASTAAPAPPRLPGSDVPPRVVTTRLITRSAAPDRVGATIGALERILIVTFILTANEAAVGFVLAAKTLARFKQLDDREFAEYYLLGTLASVAVAVLTGLLAVAALATVRG